MHIYTRAYVQVHHVAVLSEIFAGGGGGGGGQKWDIQFKGRGGTTRAITAFQGGADIFQGQVKPCTYCSPVYQVEIICLALLCICIGISAHVN